MKKTTALSLLYAVFILFVSLLFGYFVKQGNWLQTDLHTLLPSQQEWADVQVLADQQQEKQLNSQIIALIGHADEKQAFNLTDHIAQTWRNSNFSLILPIAFSLILQSYNKIFSLSHLLLCHKLFVNS